MVLAIIGILTGIALPSLRHMLGRNRLQVAQSDFVAALMHARSTAATSGKRTLFCPSPDGRQCSGDSRWEHGWLLAHDADGDHQPDAGPSYTHATYDGLRITSSRGRHDVRFRPDGSASGSNLTLLFCEPGSDGQALSVVVSNPGRVRGAPASAAQAASCLRGD
ncbi:MAG: pilus assembly protein [Rhodanobacter sp.]|nr:MAG: pilus assembly protein [Rhodanobacter sp.]TAL98449.1 MAG: pilus assembly protein [Rhodanobacter sp.]TAM42232.1 MAG: pilus assembly protein [Rhodanobacter sp.]TAN26455.1 MAG: pilus assembly protein [Rhodanobacter sp.]